MKIDDKEKVRFAAAIFTSLALNHEEEQAGQGSITKASKQELARTAWEYANAFCSEIELIISDEENARHKRAFKNGVHSVG
jgi:hypothetical protein